MCLLLATAGASATAAQIAAAESAPSRWQPALGDGAALSSQLRASARHHRRLQQPPEDRPVDINSPLGVFDTIRPCFELDDIIRPAAPADDPLGNFTTQPAPAMLRRCVASSALVLQNASHAVAALTQGFPAVKLMRIAASQPLFEIPALDLPLGSISIIDCENKWLDLRQITTAPTSEATLVLQRCQTLHGDTDFFLARRLWTIDGGTHYPCDATQPLAAANMFPRWDPRVRADEVITSPGVALHSVNETIWCWTEDAVAEIAPEATADEGVVGDSGDDKPRALVYTAVGIGTFFAALCCCGAAWLCWRRVSRSDWDERSDFGKQSSHPPVIVRDPPPSRSSAADSRSRYEQRRRSSTSGGASTCGRDRSFGFASLHGDGSSSLHSSSTATLAPRFPGRASPALEPADSPQRGGRWLPREIKSPASGAAASGLRTVDNKAYFASNGGAPSHALTLRDLQRDPTPPLPELYPEAQRPFGSGMTADASVDGSLHATATFEPAVVATAGSWNRAVHEPQQRFSSQELLRVP